MYYRNDNVIMCMNRVKDLFELRKLLRYMYYFLYKINECYT